MCVWCRVVRACVCICGVRALILAVLSGRRVEPVCVDTHTSATVESMTSLYKLWWGLLQMCICVSEVLAATWQSGQGGAAGGLLITVGGAVCPCEEVGE